MKRRMEITIETDRMVIFARNGRHRRALKWCTSCAAYVDMITSDAAAMLAQVNSLTIFHWAEAGRIHSAETTEGLLLICPNSLLHNNKRGETH